LAWQGRGLVYEVSIVNFSGALGQEGENLLEEEKWEEWGTKREVE